MSRRATGPARAAGGLLAAVVVAGCSSLDLLDEDVCGNRVIEASEDCDGFALPDTYCAAPDEIHGCRYVCDAGPDGVPRICPDGWGCGADRICRRASGTFAAPQLFDYPSGRWMATADLDGDGRSDLTTLVGHALATAFFDAEGRLVTRLAAASILDQGLPSLGDLDGDGRADVALPTDTGVGVLRGSPDRALEPTIHFRLRESDVGEPDTTTPLVVIPLDGATAADGHPEFPGDEPLLFIGSSFVPLSPAGMLEAAPATAGTLAGAPRVANLDESDAAEELALAFQDDDRIFVYQPSVVSSGGASYVALGAPEIVTVPVPFGPTGRLFVVDVDGDGHEDLVAAPGDGAPPAVALGDGTAHFDSDGVAPADGTAGSFPALAGCEAPLAMGDVDGDGLPDVALPNGLWLRADPAFCDPFERPTVPEDGSGWTSAVLADLDADGVLDLAAGSAVAPDVRFVSRAGSGAVGVFTIPTSFGVAELAAGDLDGDGVRDLAFREIAAGGDGRDSIAVAYGSPGGVPGGAVSLGKVHGVAGLVALDLAAEGTGFVDAAAELAIVARTGDPTSERGLAIATGRGDRLSDAPFLLPVAGQEHAHWIPSALGVGRFGLGSAGAGLFATVAPPLGSSAVESLLGIRTGGAAELVVATEAVALGGTLSVASGGSWLTAARTTAADPDLAVALSFDATTALPTATELAVARPDGIAVSHGVLYLDGVRPAGTLLSVSFVGVVAGWAPALTEGAVPCALAGTGKPDALAFLAVELPAADAVTTRVLVVRPEVLAAVADGTPVGASDVLGLELPHATEIPVGVGCANVDGTEARELVVVSLTGGMPRQALLRARRLDASGALALVDGVSDPLATFDASDLPTLEIPSDTADALPPVAGLAVGDFDGDGVDDVALALGTGIAILHGRAVTP
ncbi:MAG: VCBS repeat-containing protein [Polyangiaceae bacterium]|nr:VCBS repeat-containing protein [Polyangiaceae bacterium]